MLSKLVDNFIRPDLRKERQIELESQMKQEPSLFFILLDPVYHEKFQVLVSFQNSFNKKQMKDYVDGKGLMTAEDIVNYWVAVNNKREQLETGVLHDNSSS